MCILMSLLVGVCACMGVNNKHQSLETTIMTRGAYNYLKGWERERHL